MARQRGRAWVLAEGAALFAAIFFARAVFDGASEEVITLLFVIPVALVAVQLGTAWGLAAGAAGAGLQLLWDLAWVGDMDAVADYVAGGATLLLLGVVVGALADRLRHVSAESARDVTERKRTERAVESARAEAERANNAKNEFLSRMSHELRTPLNAVIGFGQLLEMDDLEHTQRESVDQILKGGRHLLDLINEVLDISRIESGTMSMSVEPVHLGSVLAEAVSMIRPLADSDEVSISVDPSELGEMHVLGDQQRLKQVVINLLSNAIKYNRRGGAVRVHCETPRPGLVEVTIADTGLGMTPDQLERLFEPFDRLGAERTDVDGTGLGLPLSRRLMDAMGGAIEAEAEAGVGTTMRIQLQRANEPEARQGAPAAPLTAATGGLLERRTIVYIEDNLSNITLVEGVLARLPDIRLIPAMQGQLGLDLVREYRPDMVLVDLHLPDLDGREILARLKADPVTADIPVVVLSADATAGQVERLRAAGAADYLTKPLEVERLLDILAGGRPIADATPPVQRL